MTSATQQPSGVLGRLLRDEVGVAVVLILALISAVSILAPLLAQVSPNAVDLNAALQSPSSQHLLGTDSAGRDTLSRLLYGGQQTLLAAIVATAVALLIGIPSGLVAGYYGKWLDTLGIWGSSVLLSLPAIVVLLAVRASFGPSVWISMTTLGVLTSAGLFRVVRGSVRNVRGELYVDAARVSGLSDLRIIGRHIFGVVRAPIIIQSAFVAGVAIGVQAGLEFLGLGDPSVPSWGTMLSEGFRNIFVSPWLTLCPAIAISLTITCLMYFGNSVRDALEDNVVQRARRRPVATSVKDRGSEDVVNASSSSLLEVRELSVGYPSADGSIKTVVHKVSLQLNAGETLAIVGESGSGKSQIAFSILDLLPDTAQRLSGDVFFDGKRYGGAAGTRNGWKPRYGSDIAYIPQEPMNNLDPAFTIGHQLIRPIVKVMGINKREARERAISLLTRVGIRDPHRTMGAYPHEISGGMAQRVLIAGAVSCSPRVLIADEPTTALDVTVQAEVLDLLRELQSELGMALVLVTHDFGVVADLCQRVLVVESGAPVEHGLARDVLSNPQHEYTQLLLSAMLEGKQPMSQLVTAGEAAS